MSLLTIRKRIALVAVTALTAGILSVATSPVANAAAGDIDINLRDSSVTGVCSVLNGGTAAYDALTGTIVDTTLAAPRTVTMSVGGTLAINVESTHITYSANGVVEAGLAGSAVRSYWSPTNAADVTSARYDTSTFDSVPYLNPTYGVYYGVDNETVTFVAKQVGTVTVNSYAAAPFNGADVVQAGLAAGRNGTLTISVVASCLSTGYSATYSAFEVGTFARSNPSLTRGDTVTFGAGSAAFISILAKNGYDSFLPSTTTFVVSATNGALVKLAADSATPAAVNATTYSDGTLSSVSGEADGDGVYVKVVPASKTAGGTTVVTVSVGTTTVLTKNLTFLPEATKLVVVKNLVGSIAEGEGAFSYQLQTASGQVVPGSIAVRPLTLDSRVTNVTENKAATINPAAPGNVYGAASTGYFGSTTTNGIMNFACNTATTSGTTTVTMRHTTPVTETVIDTPVTVRCSGGLATYTMSLNAAAYKIGEVATITITGKDSAGNVVKDNQAFTADVFSVGGGSMVANSKTTDLFSDGVKTFQAQMTTAGSFNAVSTLAGSVTKTATAAYTVSGGDASNAEVLKSIVALIASINKQIQALQKLILKR
jgi:hypothetical protein